VRGRLADGSDAVSVREGQIELMETRITAWGAYSRRAAHLSVDEGGIFGCTLDDVVVRMTTRVLTQTLEDKQATVSFSTPSTWWQHWKQDRAPGWLKRRWPVRLTTIQKTVEYKVCAMYPKADLLLPKLGPAVIHVLRTDKE
jgi:hypothetical protein